VRECCRATGREGEKKDIDAAEKKNERGNLETSHQARERCPATKKKKRDNQKDVLGGKKKRVRRRPKEIPPSSQKKKFVQNDRKKKKGEKKTREGAIIAEKGRPYRLKKAAKSDVKKRGAGAKMTGRQRRRTTKTSAGGGK